MKRLAAPACWRFRCTRINALKAQKEKDIMTNAEIVKRFEEEFKAKGNFSIVDELMAPDFVHHLPYPGLPLGREGMKAV
jgi:hypothetical protein